MNKSNTHKKPTIAEAKVGGKTREVIPNFSHSTGYVLADTKLAYQPRPGAGKRGGDANPAMIELSSFNA